MEKLLSHPPTKFKGFGPSILAPQTRGRLVRHSLPVDRQQARELLHDHCPLSPGVYGWLDSNQQICYVGKSKELKKRLLSYFAKNPTDPKADRIRRHSSQLVWEPMSDEFLALLREQELIHRWRPNFNTQGQPTRRQPAFIGISNTPAPHAFFTRQLTTKARHLFGPIAGTGELRNAIESLNQVFRLRDCPDKTKFEYSNQLTLFDDPITAKCIRHELGTCTAPCAGRCSQSSYQRQVDDLVRFLQGADSRIIDQIEREMGVAASEQRYERATTLRNHLISLRWLNRRLANLRTAKQKLNGVLPVIGHRKQKVWLLLRGGRLVGSLRQPQRSQQAMTAIQLLTQSAACQTDLPTDLLDTHWQLIVISWFRRNAQMKDQLMSVETAIEKCQKVSFAKLPNA